MKRGRVLTAIAAAAAFASCGGRRPAAPLRNVVLIVVDTLRQDHLSAYGYRRETAPTFSRLAAEGVLWNGVSPTSWTKPAVASILTGLHPVRHQAFGNADLLPEGAKTLAERLRARGYTTLGITANAWVSGRTGFGQGFQAYYSMVDDFKHGAFSTAEEVNSELLPRLRGLSPPYFLFVHYLDPHAPYDPVHDYRGWPLSGRLARREKGIGILELRMNDVLRRPADLVEDAIDLYDGEIRQADDGIGALLRELRRLGLHEGTLTVVTSDHGEEMEEHGRMGHGSTLYEEVVRVPLVFHGPGVLPAAARFGTASLLDIVPTIMGLVSEPIATSEVDGLSLASWMTAPGTVPPERTERTGERELLLHLDLENKGRGPVLQGGRALALRGGRFKLVLSQVPYGKELFDHVADPREQVNQLPRQDSADIVKPMAVRLADRYNVLSGAALTRSADAKIDQAEALAALGYLGPGAIGSLDRRIPPRIRPADPAPDGWLGWPER